MIGWREWVALPGLNIPRIKAKVDTGARTSALHAFSIETFRGPDDVEWVRFGMHPVQDDQDTVIYCEAPIKDRRTVRDSGGHETERIVIETEIRLGENHFPAEITLTDRDNMLFRMLLGRTSLNGRCTVDPQKSYLTGKPTAGKQRS
ncbi:MAG: ATP-dependent zinc protease [Gammaproteobacteria bacterium]|nr:ATP-dependent zinc protease [Gammaproteobacteria bacterium]